MKELKAMPTLTPRYTKEEFAQRGDEMYAQRIHPFLKQNDLGKFVVIDVETGAYEVDVDELTASDRLLSRLPTAQVWVTQVGSRYARHFGAHHRHSAAQ